MVEAKKDVKTAAGPAEETVKQVVEEEVKAAAPAAEAPAAKETKAPAKKAPAKKAPAKTAAAKKETVKKEPVKKEAVKKETVKKETAKKETEKRRRPRQRPPRQHRLKSLQPRRQSLQQPYISSLTERTWLQRMSWTRRLRHIRAHTRALRLRPLSCISLPMKVLLIMW